MVDKRAKQKLLHTCGYWRVVTAFDAEKINENDWIKKLEESDCPACWRRKQPPTFALRTRQGGGLALDVSRGYPLKDVLRDRGYFFQRPRWIKHFGSVAEREKEIAWIRELGYEVHGGE